MPVHRDRFSVSGPPSPISTGPPCAAIGAQGHTMGQLSARPGASGRSGDVFISTPGLTVWSFSFEHQGQRTQPALEPSTPLHLGRTAAPARFFEFVMRPVRKNLGKHLGTALSHESPADFRRPERAVITLTVKAISSRVDTVDRERGNITSNANCRSKN